MVEQRQHAREPLELSCILSRHTGNPIQAKTKDVGAGGMRIVTERPLRIDEVLEYDLAAGAGEHLHGTARVMRQQTPNTYALRFDLAVDSILQWVSSMSAG